MPFIQTLGRFTSLLCVLRAPAVYFGAKIAGALVLLLIPFSAQSAEPNQPPLKIGLLALPQEPDFASLRQGAALGIELANRLSGLRAELVIRGRPGQWGTEGDEAAALVFDEAVAAMIAPPSGSASHQVMQVAGRTRIPVVSLCSDSSVTGSGIPWVSRITPRSDAEAQTIFTGLTNKSIGWAALVPDGRSGREAAKDLSNAAKTTRSSLAEPVRLPVKEAEWPAALQKLLSTRPTGVLLWLDADSAAKVAQKLVSSGFHGVRAGPARLNSPAFFKSAGNAAEGLIIPAISAITDGKEHLFRELYRKKFGMEPDFTATMAADTAFLLTEILRKSGDQPPYKLFPLKQSYPGITGNLTFDKDGNRQLALQLLVCRDGHFTPMK